MEDFTWTGWNRGPGKEQGGDEKRKLDLAEAERVVRQSPVQRFYECPDCGTKAEHKRAVP